MIKTTTELSIILVYQNRSKILAMCGLKHRCQEFNSYLQKFLIHLDW